MSLDVLAFGPHPDDVELFCGGTIAKLVRLGYSIGLIDLTRGELGSRGSREERDNESKAASEILGIQHRESLNLPDGFINSADMDQRHKIVEVIRKHQPQLVFGPAAIHRHPDHIQGARLIEDAVFLANVAKYPSDLPRHKVKALMMYPMWWHPEADIIVDVSEDWKTRMDAVKAYRTQFNVDPGVTGPETFLSSERFLEWVEGRGSQFGAIIGVSRGEPYLLHNPVPIGDPFQLLVNGAGEANP